MLDGMTRYEVRGPVAWLTLDRPEKLNAMTRAFFAELAEHMAVAGQDEAVRVVVIHGAGKCFSVGGDIEGFGELGGTGDRRAYVQEALRSFRAVEELSKPTIAAVHGHALGGGCEISMACHIRILKESARMGQTESNLGIIPGYGGTQRFPRLIGRGLALEHLILGTQIPAPECYRIGLANRLSKEGETLNDAKALAREIVKRPPIASRLIIEAVDDGIQAPIDQAIEIEVRAFDKVLKTEDAGEGIQAFFQKRPAQFKGK